MAVHPMVAHILNIMLLIMFQTVVDIRRLLDGTPTLFYMRQPIVPLRRI